MNPYDIEIIFDEAIKICLEGRPGPVWVEIPLDVQSFNLDLKKIKTLFKTLEEKTKLIRLLDSCLQQDGLTVVIGAENSDEEMSGCSLIASNYGLDEDKMGTIAVFGPKRMDYKNIISIVNHTAKKVSKLLSERKMEYKKII